MKSLARRGYLSVEEFIAVTPSIFPDEEARLRDFMAVCVRGQERVESASARNSRRGLEQAAEAFPTVLRYRAPLLQEVIDEYLVDSRLKAVV